MAKQSSHAHSGRLTSSLDPTGHVIFLSRPLANSTREITKDESNLRIAWTIDTVFPAPLAIRARRIALIDQSLGIFVRANRQTYFDSASSTLYATIARLSSVDH
jgi:hypothetical protein